jgi:transcriptional regulator
MTKNALTILDIVNNSYDHPTAEDIFLKLKAKKSKMVLATVYNNLNMLCEKGLVRRLSIDGVSDRFDHANRHDHLYCSSCGKIADVKFDDLTQMIEEKLGTNILSYKLQVNYICPDCMEALHKKQSMMQPAISVEDKSICG